MLPLSFLTASTTTAPETPAFSAICHNGNVRADRKISTPTNSSRSPSAFDRMIDALSKAEGDREELVGVEILRSALTLPLWQIAENAGVSGAVVVDAVKKLKGNMGYNAATNVY